ncbi:hypothetical protein QEN19_000059 [Hanseniaspora menglaensis]
MSLNNNNFELDSDLDLEIDLSGNDQKNEISSIENELISGDGLKDPVTTIATIRDYFFKLQKQPEAFESIVSYPAMLNELIFECKEKVQHDTSISLSDLFQLDHSSRLLLKFINNIIINIINKKFSSKIDLIKLFNIIDNTSMSYVNILNFNNFLLHSNKVLFKSSEEFIEKVNFTENTSLNSLLTLEVADVVWPFKWDISIIDIFSKLSTVIKSIFTILDQKIKAKLMETVPNLINLFNGNFEIITQIFTITKGLENLIKMNNKTLAGLGKIQRKDSETTSFLFKSINKIFPILIENEKLVNDIMMKQLKLKIVQRLSSKILLVAKIDFYSSSPDGSKGLDYHMDMIQTIENWIENDQPNLEKLANKDLKPLSIPKDNNYVDGKNKKAKKRAGEKLTKYRQKFKKTGKLDILQNRIEFGKEEKFSNGKDQYMDNMEDGGLGMASSELAKLKNHQKRNLNFSQKKPRNKKNKNYGKVYKS